MTKRVLGLHFSVDNVKIVELEFVPKQAIPLVANWVTVPFVAGTAMPEQIKTIALALKKPILSYAKVKDITVTNFVSQILPPAKLIVYLKKVYNN